MHPLGTPSTLTIGKSDAYRPLRVDEEGRLIVVNFGAAVAQGLIPGVQPFSAYGEKTTVGAEENILWPDGVYALPPAAGVQLSLVSASASDAAAGTGIRSVEIHGLDTNLAEVSEQVTLNGLTPVLTARTNWRFIQCMHMKTYGSGKKAAGTISASVGAQTYSEIAVGRVRCSSSVRMVPAGKRVLVDGIYGGSVSGSAAAATILRLVSCHFDGHDYTADSIFFPLGAAAFQDGSGGMMFPTPIPIDAGAAFGLSFSVDKAATVVGTWFGRMGPA